jgi:hypothetical protein
MKPPLVRETMHLRAVRQERKRKIVRKRNVDQLLNKESKLHLILTMKKKRKLIWLS